MRAAAADGALDRGSAGLPSGSVRFAGYLCQRRRQYASDAVGGAFDHSHGFGDVGAPIASGSFPVRGMAIVPCSMGTLGRLATGASSNLIERAADVTLKERRRLVLVARETPLSLIHLRNMTAATEAGAVVLPAAPGFYHRPTRVEDLVDFVVARALDHLGVAHRMGKAWTGEPE